jgi:hypothetical protein
MLIQAGGPLACFIYYGSFSFLGLLYILFFLKDTTYMECGINKVAGSEF